MLRRQLWIVCAVLALVLAISIGLRIAEGDPAAIPASPSVASDEPFVWDVTLDPHRRPYDVDLLPGAKLERRRLTVLHAPSRRIRFMGGEYLASASLHPQGVGTPVTLAERSGRRYPVDAIWETYKGRNSIVGVVLVERDVPIARWEELHNGAYVTDGGTGGITTHEWAALPKGGDDNPIDDLYWSELVDNGRPFFLGDADGYEGVDTIGFSNGWGDGSFPSVAGYDASGTRAAIVLWSVVAPWRLAFPQGRPPPEVTKAENDFAACLKGTRKVQGSPCRLTRQ